MSELDANVLVGSQLAVATLAQEGTIVSGGGEIDATALIQTESGKQLAVKTYSVGSGGEGGTSDYADLENKPQINGVTLVGDKSSGDLGLQDATKVALLPPGTRLLETNTIYNGGTLSNLTLTLPEPVPLDFIAQVQFKSGPTPTTFTAPASLYFNGDACEAGVFTPVADKRYCILIISAGSDVLGFVYEK